MPTLNIAGRKVNVGDEFLKLSPEQQQATVDEIVKTLGLDAPSAMEQDPSYKGDLQSALQKKADEMVIGKSGPVNQGYSFLSNMGNTLALGAPRYLAAGAESLLGKAGVPGFEPDFGKAREQYKQMDERYSRQNPGSAIAGTVAGIGGQIASLPASIGTGSIARGAQALGMGAEAAGATGRVLGSAGLGAGMGATEAALDTNFDPVSMVKNAATGALGGAVGGAVAEKVGSALANRAAQKAVNRIAPSTDDLGRIASQKYDEARAAGVWFSPQGFGDLVNDIKTTLSSEGVDKTLHPKVMATVGRLEDEAGKAVTFDKLDLLRRVANSAAKSKEPDEGRLARIVIRKLDEFAENPPQGGVLFGNGPQAAQAYKEARAAYAAKSRSDRISGVVDAGKLNADVAGSGANVDNTIRQAARSLLKSKNGTMGMSKDEIAALRDVASGGPIRNALRALGKFAPTGVVSSVMSGGAGFGAAGPVGAVALPAVGYVAKKAADYGTQKSAENAAALARTRIVPGAAQQIQAARNSPNIKRLQQMLALMAIQTGVAASPDGIR